MGKLIVFEGISGSGKSYLINQVKTAVHNVEETKWFDNKYVGDLFQVSEICGKFFWHSMYVYLWCSIFVFLIFTVFSAKIGNSLCITNRNICAITRRYYFGLC